VKYVHEFILVQVCKIPPPSQSVSKNWLTKVNVFCSKFVWDTSTYVDPLLLTFWDGDSISSCSLLANILWANQIWPGNTLHG